MTMITLGKYSLEQFGPKAILVWTINASEDKITHTFTEPVASVTRHFIEAQITVLNFSMASIELRVFVL
jgi:hypothetical protein